MSDKLSFKIRLYHLLPELGKCSWHHLACLWWMPCPEMMKGFGSYKWQYPSNEQNARHGGWTHQFHLFLPPIPYEALSLALDIIWLQERQLPVISAILKESQGICLKVFVQMKPHVASRVLWAWSRSLLALGELRSSSRRKSDVSLKPGKIKETCIGPKQHSSCVGIAQDWGLSSLLASERPGDGKESRQLLSPSVLLFSLLMRNWTALPWLTLLVDRGPWAYNILCPRRW